MFFPELPDTARLWVYGSDAPLTPDEQSAIMDRLTPFLAAWTSHGRSVRGRADILEDRFLLVAADLPEGDISGCGIDASVHAVEAAAEAVGRSWLSALTIFYRDEAGAIQALDRAGFRRLVRAGGVTTETPVFDLTPQILADTRTTGLERPAGAGWHARVFRIPEPV